MAGVWIPHKPEQRFSMAVKRLLSRCLIEPMYATAQHDADEGGRTDNQRARDAARGIRPGPLDWEVWQGPGGLARRVELKRGRNKTSPNQDVTIDKLTACGAAPIVAWDLRQLVSGLQGAGFRFTANLATVLAETEAQLAGWDREADAVKAGTSVRKVRRAPKAEPRFTFGKKAVARARAGGIRL